MRAFAASPKVVINCIPEVMPLKFVERLSCTPKIRKIRPFRYFEVQWIVPYSKSKVHEDP